MNALAGAHDPAIRMADCPASFMRLVDTDCQVLQLALTAGEAHDNRIADRLLSRLKLGTIPLADRGNAADWIRTLILIYPDR